MTTTTITPKPATEEGALDGFSTTCPICSMELASSMESNVERDLADHLEWHAKRGETPARIWYASWGYDQTNVEFFEEVRETAASLVLRRIQAEVRDGRLYPLAGQYATDCHLMGNSTMYDEHGDWVPNPTYVQDEERGYSEKMCRKPRATRTGYVHLSVRIDDVRTAFPYEGGGRYDTHAAGQPGH